MTNAAQIPHLLTTHNGSTIYMQTLPTDKRAIHTPQPHERRRHLAGLPRPAHRRCEFLLRLSIHRRGDERRPDGPRAHAVNADAVANLLIRERACEGNDGALGGGVVEQVRPADVRVYAGAGYDCGTWVEVRQGVFRKEEEGMDIGCERVEPLIAVFGSELACFASNEGHRRD